jgi:hypothetical protein
MKINLAYNKIPDTKNYPCVNCIAFEKLDGSNVSFYWEPNKGFVAFGTRRSKFDLTEDGIIDFNKEHHFLTEVSSTFDKIRFDLDKYLSSLYTENVIVFAEFYGKLSFAGSHKENDEKFLTIFDVKVGDKFLPPEEFIEKFRQFPIPKVVYTGKYSGQLVEDIRKGKFDVDEGVVLKGFGTKYQKDNIFYAKVKTDKYLERLKNAYKEKWENYWE